MLRAVNSMIRLNDVSGASDIPSGVTTQQQVFLQREIIERMQSQRKGRRAQTPSQSLPATNASHVSKDDPYRISIGEISSPLHEDVTNMGGETTSRGRDMNESNDQDIYLDDESATKDIFADRRVIQWDQTVVPKVKLDCPENVIGWAYIRLILNNFGQRFRFRLQTYSSIIIAILAIQVCLTLLDLVICTDRKAVLSSIFVQQTLLAVTLMFLYLGSLIFVGWQVNVCLNDHVTSLSSHLLVNQLKSMNLNKRLRLIDTNIKNIENRWIRRDEGGGQLFNNGATRDSSMAVFLLSESADTTRIHEISSMKSHKLSLERELELIRKANDAIENSIDVLKTSNDTEPFMVMWISAQPAMFMSLVYAITGFYMTIYGFYDPEVASTLSNFQ